MFKGYCFSTVKKKMDRREDQLPHREAITGSNKGVEVHSIEAILSSSLPLAVYLFSLAQRNREREKESKGVTVSEVPCLPFSLPAISHYNAALFTFNRCGQKMVKQREAIWTN